MPRNLSEMPIEVLQALKAISDKQQAPRTSAWSKLTTVLIALLLAIVTIPMLFMVAVIVIAAINTYGALK